MNINFLAVLAAAVASMVIGSVWYGPLFGKTFTDAMGMDKLSHEEREKMKQSMVWMYAGQFIASLVMFYVFAHLYLALGTLTIHGALMTAFWLWIGFVVPLKFGEALWGGKWTLFWIGIGGNAITLIATALIIGYWR
jgi:hypothetical protein